MKQTKYVCTLIEVCQTFLYSAENDYSFLEMKVFIGPSDMGYIKILTHM